MPEHGILVLIHVAGGAVGIATGFAALLAPKGEWLHRKAGLVFVVAMAAMASAATILAAGYGLWESVLPGALTLYLVLTSWAAVRGNGHATHDDAWFAAFALGIVVLGIMLAGTAGMSPGGKLRGFPPDLYLVFAGLSGWSALWDLTFLTYRSLSNRARIARHLWRMTAALLLAVTSLFIGRPQDFPEFFRGTIFLTLPSLIVLCLLLFWVVRVWTSRQFKEGDGA